MSIYDDIWLYIYIYINYILYIYILCHDKHQHVYALLYNDYYQSCHRCWSLSGSEVKRTRQVVTSHSELSGGYDR